MNPLPFFRSPDRVAALHSAAASWLGTPFHPHAQIKSVGVDCVNLVRAIYLEAASQVGFVMPVGQFPAYTMDGGHHLAQSQMEAFVGDSGYFIPVTADPPPKPGCRSCGHELPAIRRYSAARLLPGDLLGIQFGDVVHHGGIFLGRVKDYLAFVHVYKPHAVHYGNLEDPTWQKRLLTVHRPAFEA